MSREAHRAILSGRWDSILGIEYAKGSSTEQGFIPDVPNTS